MTTLSVTFDAQTIAVFAPDENGIGQPVIECDRVTEFNGWGLEDDIDRALGHLGLVRRRPKCITDEDVVDDWITVEASRHTTPGVIQWG